MKSRFYTLSVLSILFAAACTSDFDEMDYPKTGSAVIDPNPIFTRSLVTGSGLSVGIWQFTNQLTTLDWVQYVGTIKYNFTESNYEPTPKNNVWSWWYATDAFAGMSLCDHTIRLSEQLDNPVKEAMAKIWRAYMFQFMTDMYGDIPFSEAFRSVTPKFDTQEQIYRSLINDLQASVKILNDDRTAGYSSYGTADVLYGGDIQKWIKFANSMLLRMAMQCSKVAESDITRPVLSSIDFSDPDQFISSNDDNARILPDPNGPTYHVKNPYAYVAGWDEMRITTTFYDRLNGHQDPRMTIIMDKNQDGKYLGMAPGQPVSDLAARYDEYKADYCDIGSFFTQGDTQFMLYSASEAYFLLSEAISKGYVKGTASDYYRKGIQASMDYYGVSQTDAESFIGRVPYSADNLYEQFWIALFPDGPQAWNLVRRTGKPSIKPLIYSWPDNDQMPRRYSYSTDELRYNNANATEAINRMGGDSQYTRVWWDEK